MDQRDHRAYNPFANSASSHVSHSQQDVIIYQAICDFIKDAKHASERRAAEQLKIIKANYF